MSEEKNIRINKVIKDLNISLDRAVEFLKGKGVELVSNPNTKISDSEKDLLYSEFAKDKGRKEASIEVGEEKRKEKEALRLEREKQEELQRLAEEKKRTEVVKAKGNSLPGLKTVGKIDLDAKKTPDTPVETIAPVETEIKPVPAEKVVEAEAASVEEVVPSVTEVPKVEVKEAPAVEVIKEEPKVETPVVTEPKETPKAPALEVETIKHDSRPIQSTLDVAPTEEKIVTQFQTLTGPKATGQVIDLSQFDRKKKKEEPKQNNNQRPGQNQNAAGNDAKNKRKRIQKPFNSNNNAGGSSTPGQGGQGNNRSFGNNNAGKGGYKGQGQQRPVVAKVEPTEEEVQKQIRETLEKLQGKGKKNNAAKYRRDKRDSHRQRVEDENELQEKQSKILKVTEFVTVGEVATMMDVPITKVIGTCMSLGIMVTMNQRLDAETLTIVADEFGYEVEFVTTDIEEAILTLEDHEDDLLSRAPIVTVMGHVDHGKTSLLDYIRKTNVIAGESGGITQHIGAYSVALDGGQKITFLDTPGHEAFTAMRARGAQITDIVIIVIAADDDIMPQTKEAISHAQAAGVPMIFAINKIDKPTANVERIKERLAAMNLLVEDWGGKIQSHDISAKQGLGVKELLEKVLLEAEMLDLKANPNKPAVGAVVEAFLDKGRGYISTVLVQAGTLRIGDYVLAGKHHGKVRAMQDERGKSIKVAGPSTPISILGLDGAPTAGDKFNVFEDEREAKQIATKRIQLLREQSVRTQKHITLAEIGRRIALGQFKELNIILKGDVDGSVEALSDSFSKLSTDEVQIKIIHKAVGAITESDVLLASASDAIIIGFNVRPQGNAKVLAEKEEIDIKTYSIIYDAIDDLRDAMEGMLSPELKEEISGTAEIRETFKISKVGTIAGCMVTNGKVFRSSKIRLIREGVVIYTGELAALKRFKDDVKEVSKGYDCGIQIKNYNDIQINDVIECFTTVEVKKKLK